MCVCVCVCVCVCLSVRETERELKRQVIPICGAVNAGPAYCAHQHQLTSANSPHNKPVTVIGWRWGAFFVLFFLD